MDQELKQRLIGAAVITALAAIFIPMLFDDPVDTSGQAVSEMTIPEPPANVPNGPESKLPADAASLEHTSGPGSLPVDDRTPIEPMSTSATNAADIERIEPELQEPPLDFEPPAEVDTTMEQRLDQAAEGQPMTATEAQQKIDASTDIDNAVAPDEPVESVQSIEDAPKSTPAVTETKKTPVKPAPAPIKAPAKPKADSNIAKPTPKKPATAAKAETAKPASGFERWYVQAGSYAKKDNAMSQWEALRKQGLPVLLETQPTNKGTIYRLRIGPEMSKQRAVDIKNRLAQQNIKSIIIVE
ncbi:MAG: SPOR domain-containing protein [Methylococcaceae bacterium]|nr:SPOR domain-containing protein [Methylococcaceae bacterium]